MLNHSCIRCRSKKLRCDGSSPCGNCRAKGLGHGCSRPLRKERPRKKDLKQVSGLVTSISSADDGPIPSASSISVLAPPSSATGSLGGELRDGASHLSVPSASRSRLGVSKDEGVASNHKLLGANSKRVQEPFVAAPPALRGCLATQQQIDEARELFSSLLGSIRLVKYVIHWRCQSMAHSAIHLPTLKRLLRQIFSDEWAGEVTQDQLALVLMTIAISIQFAPRQGPYAHVWKLVQDLGSLWTPPERQRKLHQLARSILQGRLQDPATRTLEGAQTAVLMLLYDLDDEGFKEHLFTYAVKCCQALDYHNVQSTPKVPPPIQTEMGVRVWWYLVTRDWLAGLSRGSYSLHPQSFTARLPTLITDDDLSESRFSLRDVAESSTVGISFPFITLASVVRELVDARPTQTAEDFQALVADAFDHYAENLPHIFSLGASATYIPNIGTEPNLYIKQRLETERWLLHQQIFHAYLQLYDLRLDTPVCNQMAALANHILDLQDKVRTRCHIIDHMRINVTGVLRAIMVLTVDLMQKHKDSKVSLVRQLTLGKIHEAVRKCQDAPTLAEGDLDNVRRLIDMEEVAWRSKIRTRVSSTGSVNSAQLSIAATTARFTEQGQQQQTFSDSVAPRAESTCSSSGPPLSGIEDTSPLLHSLPVTNEMEFLPENSRRVVPASTFDGSPSNSHSAANSATQSVSSGMSVETTSPSSSDFGSSNTASGFPIPPNFSPSAASQSVGPGPFDAPPGGLHVIKTQESMAGQYQQSQRPQQHQQQPSTLQHQASQEQLRPPPQYLHPPGPARESPHTRAQTVGGFPPGHHSAAPSQSQAVQDSHVISHHDQRHQQHPFQPQGDHVQHHHSARDHGPTNAPPFARQTSNGHLHSQLQHAQQQQQHHHQHMPAHTHAHAHSAPGLPVASMQSGGDVGGAQHHQPQQHHQHHQHQHQQHQHQHQQPQQPIPATQNFVADFSGLLPSDQAFSPLFAPSAQAHEPSWEELYASLMGTTSVAT